MRFRSALTAALVLIAALAAPPAGAQQASAPPPPAPPGPLPLLKARCIFCHDAPLMLAFSNRVLDQGGPEALDALLARHHAPDAEARETILKFLENPMAAPQ